MQRLASLLLIFLCSCELPQPVRLDEGDLLSKLDPSCKLPLDERNLFDTLQVNGRFYGFCSGECKTAFKEGRALIPCPLPGS